VCLFVYVWTSPHKAITQSNSGQNWLQPFPDMWFRCRALATIIRGHTSVYCSVRGRQVVNRSLVRTSQRRSTSDWCPLDSSQGDRWARRPRAVFRLRRSDRRQRSRDHVNVQRVTSEHRDRSRRMSPNQSSATNATTTVQLDYIRNIGPWHTDAIWQIILACSVSLEKETNMFHMTSPWA